MKHDILIRFAELSYVRSIPDLLHGELRQGRLKNLYDRLVKTVDQEFIKLPMLSEKDVIVIRDIIVEFGKFTGWTGRKKHIATLLSFTMAMLEESEHPHNPEIINILTSIADYYERKSRFKFICCDAGAIAARKWKIICSPKGVKNERISD